MTKILIVLNDQGGGAIDWNYEEVSPALRREMRHHEPTVVIEDEDDVQEDIEAGIE